MKRLLTLLCQLLVGATFIFSGLVKCIDPLGSSIKIGEYLYHFQMPWLADWSIGIAWLLSFVEFAVGLSLFFGRNLRTALLAATGFMTVFTPLTLYLAIANPVDDCGCFGDALVLTNWQTFWKNVVLFLAICWLWWQQKRVVHLLNSSLFTFYFYGASIVALTLCGIGTWRLPFIDFRPYRPGVDLRSAVLAAPACADAGSSSDTADTQYVIVYQRDGEIREFMLDSIPDEDSGWEFVESKEVRFNADGSVLSAATQEELQQQQRKGDSWITSFFVLDNEGADATPMLLSDTGYVFLLISPSLGEAHEHDIDRIELIYEYALQQGYPFICLTLKDEAQIERWRFRTGAEYPMLFSDATVLETMMRPNPGLMLLHDGRILWKNHLAELDVQALTSAKLSEQTYGKVIPIDRKHRVFWIILWLIAPLFLYLPVQLIISTIFHSKKQ